MTFFFYTRARPSACPFMASVGPKSQGGGEPWCLDQPPLGGYPPPCRPNTRVLFGGVGGGKVSVQVGIRKKSPKTGVFLAPPTILGVDLIPGLRPGMGGPPPPPPSGGGRGGTPRLRRVPSVFLSPAQFLPDLEGGRSPGPKTGFSKKHEKRVFRQNPKVQRGRFSYMGNRGFFMGYPLAPG